MGRVRVRARDPPLASAQLHNLGHHTIQPVNLRVPAAAAAAKEIQRWKEGVGVK